LFVSKRIFGILSDAKRMMKAETQQVRLGFFFKPLIQKLTLSEVQK